MRARRLPADDRKRIASLGGRARALSLQAARRILETLRYAAALRDLQGPPPRVARLAATDDRLPGIYPAGR
jgi:hypothetical protein